MVVGRGHVLPAWLARGDVIATATAVLFLVQAAIRFTSHLSGDVAWYLYAAGRLLDGATLYVDLIEVSSPLGLWLAVPVVWLARLVALNPIAVLKSVLLFLTLVSLVLSERLLRLAEDVPAAKRNLLLILVAALLLFLPGADFGQREHLAIVLLTPWLFLQWHRFADRPVPMPLAVIVALLAGPGFLVKPHFVFAFVAILLVVSAIGYNWRNAVRVEQLIVFALLAGYIAAAQYLLVRRFDMSILGTLAYVPFYGEPLAGMLRAFALPALLAIVAAIAAGRIDERLSLLQILAIVAGVIFVFGAAIQVGLGYQFLPARYFFALAVAIGLVGVTGQGGDRYAGLVLALAATTLVFVFGSALWLQRAEYRGAAFAEAIAREAPEAKAIFIASNRVDDAFPLVVERELVWSSRFARQWLHRFVATTLARDAATPDHPISAFMIDSVMDDLETVPPDIIFIERQEAAAPRDAFDHLGFWQRDARFDGIWAVYEVRAPIEGFDVYVRAANSK